LPWRARDVQPVELFDLRRLRAGGLVSRARDRLSATDTSIIAYCTPSSIKNFDLKRIQSFWLKVQPAELSGVFHLCRLKASFNFRLLALSFCPLAQ
jgi:hypothetical protein